MGGKNLVVVPKAMGRGGKKQKTDKRDAGELCDCLDRYLRGQDRALSVVAVPTEDQEQKRALIRYHRQIMADRGRCEGVADRGYASIRGNHVERRACDCSGRQQREPGCQYRCPIVAALLD